MKSFIRLFVLVSAAIALMGVSSPQLAKRYLVKINLSEFKTHLSEIRTAGLDVAGMNIPNGKVDLIVSLDDIETLRKIGVTVSRNPSVIRPDAPDSKFKTSEQVAQILAGFQKTYPDLAQVRSIGKSLQGRDIMAIKITEHVDQSPAGKPVILFNGMHHAREVMATEVPLDIAEYLLSNYGKDPKVTHWVSSNVIYVVPMLNVDGNNIVWNSDNMWRKNARGNFGVDINRNYPYMWNGCGGSSSSESADDYHGPSAASEPETNVLMSLVRNIHPVFDISFHSYSELVIYPYGCGQHTETADVVEPLGKAMAALIPSDSGSGTYTAGLAPELLYTVDGDDLSWMYHEAHVIPFVIELNSDAQGFQPGYDEWRDKTITKLRPAWQLLLDRLDHGSVRGEVSVPQNTRAQVRAVRVNSTTQFVQSYPVHADGSFHMIVNPGDYRLEFTGAGIQPETHVVHVGDNRLSMKLDLSRSVR